MVELQQFFDKTVEHHAEISKADFHKALGYRNVSNTYRCLTH